MALAIANRLEKKKRVPAGSLGLWPLKVAQHTALGGALISLSCPTACGPLGPMTLPSRDSERRGCLYVPPPLLHPPPPPRHRCSEEVQSTVIAHIGALRVL